MSVEKKTWDEFRATGLLWLVNSLLHTFGWAIVTAYDDETNELIDIYPARTTWRGFTQESDQAGRHKLSLYMRDNAAKIHDEAEWPEQPPED